MRATRDWSYGLLSDSEQTVLRTSRFSRATLRLQVVSRVAADAAHPESEIINFLAEVVAKSLVVGDVGRADPRLRLLQTRQNPPE